MMGKKNKRRKVQKDESKDARRAAYNRKMRNRKRDRYIEVDEYEKEK